MGKSNPSLPSKPSERSENSGSPIAIGISKPVGTIGGFDVEAEVSADVGRLLPKGKIDVGITQTDKGIDVNAGIGGRVMTPLGGFGLGVGGKGTVNKDGSIDIDSGSIRGEAGGVSVEIGSDKEGKKTVTLCYSYGVLSACVTATPDDPKDILTPPTPTPTPTPTPPGSPYPKPPLPPIVPPPTYPVGTKSFCKLVVNYETTSYEWTGDYAGSPPYQFGNVIDNTIYTVDGSYDENGILTGTSTYKRDFRHLNLVEANPGTYNYEFHNTNINIIPIDPYPNIVNSYNRNLEVRYIGGNAFELKGNEQAMYTYLASLHSSTGGHFEPSGYWAFYEYNSTRKVTIVNNTCVLLPTIPISPPLPNPPPLKHMEDCCKLVKEIHKYLGIEKLKKNKFPVSMELLVPGTSGTEDAIDYYHINQVLFKMLANGLIINPKSSPANTPFQSSNATAWAGQMYEMQAESMSNGDSTQKFEITAAMQFGQLVMIIAEMSRKIDFLSEAIGITPDITTEEVPCCFTIHESHKGFGKKQPQKINVDTAKTDKEVEDTLAKMLVPSKIPIVKWEFKSDSISLIEALRKV